MASILTAENLAAAERALAETDRLLREAYPGDGPQRQPVHTLYVPADRYHPGLPAEIGHAALEAARAHGGIAAVAALVGIPESLIAEIAPRVEAKLAAEPVEDLRLDFEDGYGAWGHETEDTDAVRAAERVREAVDGGVAPPFIGIRFKCFEADLRERALRTLDRFVSTLVRGGTLPEQLVLTLPKVSTVAQVEVMVEVCELLERAHGLEPGRLRFEVQMETAPLILSHEGTVPLARVIHGGGGRVSSLHYGTYDYSASLGIAAAYQSMDHPAADYAKQVMQVAAAGTGVHLSDGSTNIIPVGSEEQVTAAWILHARLVRRSLEAGFYQGWDLHPAQLPTRYIATYAFYREGFGAAAQRLFNYVHGVEGQVMDEPATARALARFIDRGLSCGALDEAEVIERAGVDRATLTGLAHPRRAAL